MENNDVKSPMVGDDRTQLAIHKRWPRIWAEDYWEQLQLAVMMGLEIGPRAEDPDYKSRALTAWLQGCLSRCHPNLRSGVFFFCFFVSLARERLKGIIGRGHDLRLLPPSKCSFRWWYLKIHRSQAFTFHWKRGGCCCCKGQNKGVSHRFKINIHIQIINRQRSLLSTQFFFFKKISEVIMRSMNFVWKSRNFNAKNHVFIFMVTSFTVKAWVVKCKTK